jgi:hypothetical protein
MVQSEKSLMTSRFVFGEDSQHVMVVKLQIHRECKALGCTLPQIYGVGASVQFLWYDGMFRNYCDKGAHHLEQTPS